MGLSLQNLRNPPLKCNVLAVPHHGGLIGASSSDLDWLYQEAIKAEIAVLSVGTVRKPVHPREEVIARLLTMGAKVLCTQMTSKCHVDPFRLYPGPLNPLEPFGRTVDDFNREAGRCVACAGTVVATLTEAGTEIQRLRQHQAAIDLLATRADGNPMCRPTSGVTKQ